MSNPLNSKGSGRIPQYKVINGKSVQSMFENAQFSPYPRLVENNGSPQLIGGPNDIHNDYVNDTSISSLIEYTSKYPSMKLRFADFAYLKDVGVYPNNRLMVARRFPNGVPNDLTSIMAEPMSTIISWFKDGDAEYFSIQYGEKWVPAEASFTDVLNDIGKDIKVSQEQGSNPIGKAAAAGFNAIPFGGFMEGLQYAVMQELGLTDFGIGNSPLGNPNLIREAKMRDTVLQNRAGSGLTAKISVKFEVEYEQKFIDGVDPTLAYMDIIQNALTFGTSDAVFHFNTSFGDTTAPIIKDLISGNTGAIIRALLTFMGALLNAIVKVGKDLVGNLNGSHGNLFQRIGDAASSVKNAVTSTDERNSSLSGTIQNIFAATIGSVISKYKVKLIGITQALTGAPSAPWHVTIGNPKKPMFTSGDMLCDEVTVTLGKTLGFNDLPSSIKISFNLTNARPLGAQELFNRMNTGRGRSYQRYQLSTVEVPNGTFTYSKSADGRFSFSQSSIKTVSTPPAQKAQVQYLQNGNIDENGHFILTNNEGKDWWTYSQPGEKFYQTHGTYSSNQSASN